MLTIDAVAVLDVDAPALTPELLKRWRRAGVPWWVPSILLIAWWVIGAVLGFIGDTAPCSPAEPSVCGPDITFAWAVVPLLATPILLVWMPLAGCAAGVVFGIADVIWDDVDASRWAFGTHGIACALVAVWLLRARSAQLRVMADLPVRQLPSTAEDSGYARILGLQAWLGVLAVVAGGVVLGIYLHRQHVVDQHMARASMEVVTVVESDNDTIKVRPDGSKTSASLDVYDSSVYPVDSMQPAYVDRGSDPPWVTLVAEQQDETGWLSFAVGLELLAVALIGRAYVGRRRRVHLLEHGGPTLSLRVDIDDDHVDAGTANNKRLGKFSGDRYLRSTGVEWDASTTVAFGQAFRDERPTTEGDPWRVPPTTTGQDAVLIGDIASRSWVAVVTANEVILPQSPLREFATRGPSRPDTSFWARFRKTPPVVDDPETGDLPGSAVTEAAETLPDLPLAVPLGKASRRELPYSLVQALAFVAAPVVCLLVQPSVFGTFALLVMGGTLAMPAWSRRQHEVVLDRRGMVLVGAVRTTTVPWARVVGVRQDGAHVLVGVEPDSMQILWVRPSAALDPLSAEAAAKQLARIVVRLRTMGQAAGDPGTTESSRLDTVRGFLAVYALVATLTAIVTLL